MKHRCSLNDYGLIFAFSPGSQVGAALLVFCNAVAIERKLPGVFCSAQQLFPRLPFQHQASRRVCAPRRESIGGLLALKRSLHLCP